MHRVFTPDIVSSILTGLTKHRNSECRMPLKDTEKRKAYHKDYHKSYYERNKEGYTVRKKAALARNKALTDSIKSTTPCTDCGISYPPFVMDFDHIRDKDRDVSLLVQAPASLKRLQAEIDKCEVVCANCHRMRTFTRAINLVEK
jgi:hypothetical protein